jgi:hypothetical protein
MNPLHKNVVRCWLQFIRWSRVTICWSLLLESDRGNHAETTDVARRIILQYPDDTCCSHPIGATMLRQQTWQIGVASWCMLLTSDCGNHAETKDMARKLIWKQQSSRLLHKSISRRLSALIIYYSIQNTERQVSNYTVECQTSTTCLYTQALGRNVIRHLAIYVSLCVLLKM